MGIVQRTINLVCNGIGHDYSPWEHNVSVSLRKSAGDGYEVSSIGIYDHRICHRCGGSFTSSGMKNFPDDGERPNLTAFWDVTPRNADGEVLR